MRLRPVGSTFALVGGLAISLSSVVAGGAERPRPASLRGVPAVRNGGPAEAGQASGEGPLRLLHSTAVDSGEHGDDGARGVAVDGAGDVFVAGYFTVAGQGRDIWLARFDQNLVFQDSVTINGSANGDDEGYTMAFDRDGFVYLTGYMTEAGEGHNIWLGKFDSDLELVDDLTINGSENGDDDGYGVLFDDVTGQLYLAGTLREAGEGANVWLAIFNTALVLQQSTTLNGPIDDTDKARFMTFDDERHLFVSGSMTQAGTEYDIWIGKFNADLSFVDEIVIAGPADEEDKGYGIVFAPPGTIFVTGTMIEPNESYNIWMGKFDTELNPLDELTINGPVDGEDVAYVMVQDSCGRLFHTGVYTEAASGSNIWLAEFDSDLELRGWTTVNGPANGYDTGIGLANGFAGDLYVSAIVSDPVDYFNIWVGHFDVATLFADGFETGDSSAWSATVP